MTGTASVAPRQMQSTAELQAILRSAKQAQAMLWDCMDRDAQADYPVLDHLYDYIEDLKVNISRSRAAT